MRALALAFSLAVSVAACSTAQKSRRIVECLTDPERDVLWCDGVELPWKKSGGYVCHSLEMHEAYLEECR